VPFYSFFFLFLSEFCVSNIYKFCSFCSSSVLSEIVNKRSDDKKNRVQLLIKGQRGHERGGHGLPKVSSGSVMSYPFTPCRRATPETALQPFQGWPNCKAGGLRPASTLLYTPSRTPMGRPIRQRTSPIIDGLTMDPIHSLNPMLLLVFFLI
jgi:hypothetical protein